MRLNLLRVLVWIAIPAAMTAFAPEMAVGAIHASASAYTFRAGVGNVNDQGELSAIAASGAGSDYADAHSGLDGALGSADQHLVLGVTAMSGSFGASSATAVWSDTLTMRSTNGMPLPATVTIRFTLNGTFSRSFDTERSDFDKFTSADLFMNLSENRATESRELGHLQAAEYFDLYGGGDDINLHGGTTFLGGFSGNIFTGVVEFTLPFSEVLSYTFSMSARASARWGEAGLDFSHTATLTSIVFSDGSTPESQGFSLDFDSGMTSPNQANGAVPEPATLTMFGLGALGFAGAALRRRKQAV